MASEIGQIYLEKNSTKTKLCVFVMYPIHVLLLNVSAEGRRHFVGSRYTLQVFPPVCYEIYLHDIESASKFRKFDGRLLRTVSSVVLQTDVVFQATI